MIKQQNYITIKDACIFEHLGASFYLLLLDDVINIHTFNMCIYIYIYIDI